MKSRIIFLISLIFLFFVSCSNQKIEKYEESRFLFGTYIKIIVYEKDLDLAKNAVSEAFQEIERIDNKYNSKVEGSLVYKLNKGEIKEIELDAEGQKIFKEVENAYNLSGGKFDITISPLLELWGFTEDSIDSLKLKLPKKEEIDFIKTFIDFKKVKIENNKLSLSSPIKEIDTGSFLKGYALSQAKKILVDRGITSAFITSISSIDLVGSKPNNKAWKIGLQNPKDPSDLIGITELKGKALGVSGDYQTYVEIDGEVYHHILDLETGYPVEDKKMVVVITDDAFKADLYSTVFFLMPIEKVLNFVEKQKDIEVMIIDKDMNIIKTKDFILNKNIK